MIALDTNVLIYAHESGDARRQNIAMDLITGLGDAVLLWQVCCEFIAASRKLQASGFTPELAWKRLSELIEAFPLILPTRDALDVARAIHLDHRVSFWDALIVGACVSAGVTTLYTEDKPGRSLPYALEFINPFS